MSKKVVLITGANSGFGWLTVHSVALLGHKVYAAIRDTKGKNADKAQALAQVENVTVVEMSLTEEASVKKAFDYIIAQEGTIDVLVNNAGVAMFGVVESATTDDLQRLLEVNVIAPWRLTKLALPYMRKQSEGLIINVSSGWGRFAAPFMVGYAASKFALEGLSEGLHYEVRPLGVDVAIIQPGAFPTEMSQKVQTGADAAVAGEYQAIADVPDKIFAAMGQMFATTNPNPQDVADAVVHLINLPKGQRPLRTVVDPSTGEVTGRANDAVKVEFEKALIAFGMGDLLK